MQTRRFLAENPLLIGYLWCTDILSRVLLFKSRRVTAFSRILLVHMAHFGDVVIATAAIAAVRKAYPEAVIGFLGGRAAEVVLKGHPDIAVHSSFYHLKLAREGSFGKKLWSHVVSFWRSIREIRSMKYDVAIDLYPYYPNGALPLFCAGIPKRVGWRSGGFGGLYTDELLWEELPIHMSEYMMRALEKIGIQQERCIFSLPPAEHSLALPEKYVVFHMGAGNASKEWDLSSWKEVANACTLPFLWTGKGEREKAMAAEMGGRSLVDELSWAEFTAVVRGASLVVCVDSAIAHVAAAYNIPVIALLINNPRPDHWKPYNENATAFIDDINKERVIDAISAKITLFAGGEK